MVPSPAAPSPRQCPRLKNALRSWPRLPCSHFFPEEGQPLLPLPGCSLSTLQTVPLLIEYMIRLTKNASPRPCALFGVRKSCDHLATLPNQRQIAIVISDDGQARLSSINSALTLTRPAPSL